MAASIMVLPLVSAHAQDANNADLVPVKSIDASTVDIDESDHTHPPIRLTPDKSEIITLTKDAASIIVGNPNHLGILADTSTRLILVPRAPGASYFTILDRDGNVIMQRHAIIASPKKEYVRIRKSCAASDNNDCRETRVFYCPDMCHEVIIGSDDDGSGNEGLSADAQAAAERQAVDEEDPVE
jgi:Flp pilus assembly secretin CpaC